MHKSVESPKKIQIYANHPNMYKNTSYNTIHDSTLTHKPYNRKHKNIYQTQVKK